ncbi:TetR/AcrR family transcriptional regulator [Poseidonocella sp. HB161398]|uniref:TetR/AcrR family transcriptional regulator n=1 Tax=Poseidonocella sp. HB161398 TaxID=2320855 RepID=UPI0014863322|nr:TetR/AcrR family transcriptional regulator [Poseidonocella sp. HB161398]
MSRKGEQSRERILAAAKELALRKGFAGMSVDDILAAAGVSKGAFFHHFRSRADLAAQLIRWYAEADIRMLRTLVAEAEAAQDGAMAQLLQILGAFEAQLRDPGTAPRGCMYALYSYEEEQFDEEVRALVAEAFRAWTALFIRKFQEMIDAQPPARPVTAKALAEMFVSVIEGGLILQRAHGIPGLAARQSAQFRGYLELLFPRPPQAEG